MLKETLNSILICMMDWGDSRKKEATRRRKCMLLSFKEELCKRSSKPGKKRQGISLQACFSSKLYMRAF